MSAVCLVVFVALALTQAAVIATSIYLHRSLAHRSLSRSVNVWRFRSRARLGIRSSWLVIRTLATVRLIVVIGASVRLS